MSNRKKTKKKQKILYRIFSFSCSMVVCKSKEYINKSKWSNAVFVIVQKMWLLLLRSQIQTC